jgi:SPP1 family predicted phage head-tail adaptor
MKIGGMRYRAELQRNTAVKDDEGFTQNIWQTEHTVWADIVPVSGREFLQSGTETAEVTFKIYIRWIENVDANMHVKCGENIYLLTAVLGNKRKGMLTLMAKELR